MNLRSMTAAKAQSLKASLTAEFRGIFELFDFILQVSSDTESWLSANCLRNIIFTSAIELLLRLPRVGRQAPSPL